jgi:division protein CdvB (Snf7/Vps24/ESCRT-III family)
MSEIEKIDDIQKMLVSVLKDTKELKEKVNQLVPEDEIIWLHDTKHTKEDEDV